ncbi:DUF6414 family protein [Domibacillus epiphyticus]|uniref:Uncharacterized protein n=1 Tax=Domibacillus epiphyticus TaxID=1714355 RepID=A0A1V2ABT6_9BACI|nr:hypothetical protein [Domibacillus epiphyticus]OMP68456.1 hypothetical protein BTO28_02220 [Domibacillus epiphyticus]
MKLGFRDFYYLDADYVDNLLGYIEGFIEEEVSKLEREESTAQGKAKAMGFAEATKDSRSGKEFTRRGKITPEIKFKRVIDYLIANDLDQRDTFDEELWEMIVQEEEILEVRGSLRFTQIYDLVKDAKYIGSVGSGLGVISDEEVETVTSMLDKVKEVQEKNGISIRIKTRDSFYNFVAYLNEKHLMKDQIEIVGNDFKMLCKVERLLPQGEEMKLFDLEEIEKKYSNREQRRKNKSAQLPAEFNESVEGPAAVVLPIAIYR